MSKLKDIFQKLKEKFTSLGIGVRIIVVILLTVVCISLISVFFISSSNKYKILFSNLDPVDAQLVQQKLNEQKIEMKIEGNSILVPKDIVDELRLSLAPDLTSGSKGYELLDTGSSLGMSDDEFKLKKLRMQQGELEKTIKSFPQVEDARVHITPSKDSIFVESKEPGKAAVYLKIVNGSKMSNEQVASIVALVAGSIENLPKENIEVIDNEMNLLSKNLSDSSNIQTSESVESQQVLIKKFESELQSRVVDLLEPIFGMGKVNVAINADLDFDSKQTTQIVIDPNSVVIGEELRKEFAADRGNSNSNSPVDNNMGAVIDEENENIVSSKEEEIRNYETGKTESTTISAPGQVRRLTASVAINGELDDATQRSVQNLVATAIGINDDRNDEVNVVGLAFDNNDNSNEIFEEMDKDNKTKNLILYIGLGILAIIVITMIIIFFIRKRNQDEYDFEELEEEIINEIVEEKGIHLDVLDNKELTPEAQLEDELKKYAQEKPAQVVEIIRSWLTEDER